MLHQVEQRAWGNDKGKYIQLHHQTDRGWPSAPGAPLKRSEILSNIPTQHNTTVKHHTDCGKSRRQMAEIIFP